MAVRIFLGLLFLLRGCASFQWENSSPPDGKVLYVCQGATVLIPWQYLLDAGDSVHDATWLYDGHSQEMIALLSHGQFVVLPAFSHRVQASGNAGLNLTGVQVGDSGNYTIEVDVFRDSSHVLQRRTVFLHVTRELMTQDGAVHVTQSPEAVLDPRTDQYSIQLQCGVFVFTDSQPFTVQWITPDGQVVNSSDFNDHHFTLTLPPPIKGGNYTCRIPPQQADLACLHGNAGHQGEATVFVDKVDAQLSILLKENQQLKAHQTLLEQHQTLLAQENQQLKDQLNRTDTNTQTELSQTKADLSQTKADLSQTKADLSQTKASLSHTEADLSQTKADLSQTKATLSQTEAELSQTKTDHQARLQKLEDAARHQVAFHAINLQSGHPPAGSPLVFNHVILNQGQAYNPSNGYFTCPYAGTYYFIVTTGVRTSYDDAYCELLVDNTVVGQSYTYSEPTHSEFSPAHAAVHLNTGQRVWVKGDGSSYWDNSFSMFTGFLLFHDFA